jgi:ribosome-binding factor A
MPSGGGNRRQRIASEMQRVLATLISREVKDPRVGLATVTAVRLANDMSAAKIYVLPFGTTEQTAEQGEALIEGLTRAAGFLRGEVGRSLSLRHAPQLEFELDETFDRAARLSALIAGAVKSDTPVDR